MPLTKFIDIRPHAVGRRQAAFSGNPTDRIIAHISAVFQLICKNDWPRCLIPRLPPHPRLPSWRRKRMWSTTGQYQRYWEPGSGRAAAHYLAMSSGTEPLRAKVSCKGLVFS